MPWLKLLHIGAVIVWCGALLYLPGVIAALATPVPGAVQRPWPRKIFIGLATPAALLAIGSGTLIFVERGLLAPWLMFKLAGVGLLVLAHGVCGLLVLRAERGEHRGVRVASHAVVGVVLASLMGIAWLVLRKPP